MGTDRILTTHTGSLPRPDGLLAMLKEKEAGGVVDDAAFDDAVAAAVEDCVERQLASGIDIVSDGEMSKPGYSTYVKDRLTGFGAEGSFPVPADLVAHPAYARRVMAEPALASLATPSCDGPVRYHGGEAVQADIRRFQSALRRRAAGFMTAASPGVIALFLKNRHYGTREQYLQALADAMREEYRAIHAAGLMLQLDCPDLALVAHGELAGASLKDLRRNIAMSVEALNHAVADIPPERMRLHVCWGNYEGPHHLDVEIKNIIDLLLTARPAGISFVAANPRHEHEWKVWQELHRIPEDKVLIPGVIDSTTNFIEHPELVAERIVRFARIVGSDRVIAGTDCGFATFAGLHVVEPSITWAKLEALAAGARIATEVLRPRPPRAQPRPTSPGIG